MSIIYSPIAAKVLLVIADIDHMVGSSKKSTWNMKDCRECPYFHWDFGAGRFFCENAKDCVVEDLHLIPAWCPLASIRPAALRAKDKVCK